MLSTQISMSVLQRVQLQQSIRKGFGTHSLIEEWAHQINNSFIDPLPPVRTMDITDKVKVVEVKWIYICLPGEKSWESVTVPVRKERNGVVIPSHESLRGLVSLLGPNTQSPSLSHAESYVMYPFSIPLTAMTNISTRYQEIVRCHIHNSSTEVVVTKSMGAHVIARTARRARGGSSHTILHIGQPDANLAVVCTLSEGNIKFFTHTLGSFLL
jgi:hypothetical protein